MEPKYCAYAHINRNKTLCPEVDSWIMVWMLIDWWLIDLKWIFFVSLMKNSIIANKIIIQLLSETKSSCFWLNMFCKFLVAIAAPGPCLLFVFHLHEQTLLKLLNSMDCTFYYSFSSNTIHIGICLLCFTVTLNYFDSLLKHTIVESNVFFVFNLCQSWRNKAVKRWYHVHSITVQEKKIISQDPWWA